ncbi:hypothetical protein L596_029254 [Steinernema carpocapsae]|uniref:Uncharacterized protein n=1 Tax=Steinernema carpocapsae TaxID=34508 RepID=A0A4U5LU34_STECR|nr:hypothetical protein L596_029254 [Steinernema carpocapsae]
MQSYTDRNNPPNSPEANAKRPVVQTKLNGLGFKRLVIISSAITQILGNRGGEGNAPAMRSLQEGCLRRTVQPSHLHHLEHATFTSLGFRRSRRSRTESGSLDIGYKFHCFDFRFLPSLCPHFSIILIDPIRSPSRRRTCLEYRFCVHLRVGDSRRSVLLIRVLSHR